jgi:putative transposase
MAMGPSAGPSFAGKVRDEVLAVEAFDSLLEAKTVIEEWRNTYNQRRPHSSLGWKTPAAYAVDRRT